MNGHLSFETLNSLADGELAGEELARADRHLAECAECTSSALTQSLLKSATGKAGHRYAPSPGLRERLASLAVHQERYPERTASDGAPRPARGFAAYGWAMVAAMLLVCAGLLTTIRATQQKTMESSEIAALVTEVCDQHIAALAGNGPPEVISSDRHTVKPWFQGKLPFSFNLPQNLPEDTTLEGANLTYLHGETTAQLLYSIGKHHVSVFVQQRAGAPASRLRESDHAGFHVAAFHTEDLEAIAVSDVDPARLTDLLDRFEHAQTESEALPK